MTTTEKMLSAENAVTNETFTYDDLIEFEGNDFGNAQRFLKFIDGRVLYDSMSSNWLLYGSGRWKQDNDRKERVHKLAYDLYSFLLEGLKKKYQYLESYGIDILKGKARDIGATDVSEKELNEIREQLKQCQRDREIVLKLGNHCTQNRIVKCAESRLVDNVAKLNPNDHYLVVENGTVDLKTGQLLDHNPENYSTMRAPVKYNPESEAPTRFLQFLDEIFDGDAALMDYVHRLLGYCLTGETREHEFYILYGSGGNGKSVLINLLKRLLDEYTGEVSVGALAHRADGDKPNSTLLQAKDCRILITNESDKDARLNTSLIKQISAGDEICPRALRKANEHFVPHMKILWVTNHIPKLDWNDGGMERRIRLIPFPVTIPKEKRDFNLPDNLWEEREAILKWLVDGAVAYYQYGMAAIPEVMQDAMDRERFSADSINGFLKEMVIPTGNSTDRLKAHEVYNAYKQFCTDCESLLPKTETMFGRRFQKLIQDTSIIKTKCSDGMYYQGLKLLSKNDEGEVTA